MFSSRRKAGISLWSWLVFIFRRFIESSVNLEVSRSWFLWLLSSSWPGAFGA